MAVTWWIGCSGFHYKHWKEIFYPTGLAQSKWFGYYCEHFNTLELNVSFYRFPRLEALETWYKNSPKNFKFAVKAPRAITHYKKFIGTEQMMGDFYGTVQAGLDDKIGTVLFQMSPRFVYSPERLERVLTSMNPAFDNVVEFRDASWWNKAVYDEFARNQVGFCAMSHPSLPADLPPAGKIVYERFHGVPELYKSKYTLDELEGFVGEVTKHKKHRTAYVYFNNDIGGSAIINARELQQLTDTTNRKIPPAKKRGKQTSP